MDPGIRGMLIWRRFLMLHWLENSQILRLQALVVNGVMLTRDLPFMILQ